MLLNCFRSAALILFTGKEISLDILLEESVLVAATMLKNSNIPVSDSSPAVGDVNKL